MESNNFGKGRCKVINLPTYHESQIPMLTDEEEKSITLLKEKLNKEFRVKNIILFGSKARADWDLDSDLDILVLVEDLITDKLRKRLSDIQYEVVSTYFDSPLMCIVYNYEDWLSPDSWIPIRSEVEKEGIIIEQ